jgi:hypothetical protein
VGSLLRTGLSEAHVTCVRITEIGSRGDSPLRGEWQPRMPERLDDEELADWRGGRNAVYQLLALTIGARRDCVAARCPVDSYVAVTVIVKEASSLQ